MTDEDKLKLNLYLCSDVPLILTDQMVEVSNRHLDLHPGGFFSFVTDRARLHKSPQPLYARPEDTLQTLAFECSK